MPEAALVQNARDAMITTLERTDATIAYIGSLAPLLAARMSGYADKTNRIVASLKDSSNADRKCLDAASDHLAELLGFCVAVVARKAGLDDGLTEIAEAWLDDMSTIANLPRVAVVIPAEDEFTDMAAHVIRLRMPLEGVWGLTVAAHEYGHFLASKLTERVANVGGLPDDSLPIEAKLRKIGMERPKLYRLGHELFADCVAVAIAGPAFIHHCLCYRFDVTSADGSSDTHPSFARRMQVQLDVLNKMAEKGDSSLSVTASLIGDRWKRLTAAAGANGIVEDDEDLDQLSRFFPYFVMTNPTVSGLMYRDHHRAVELATGDLDGWQEQYSVAHVLNAAWSARLRLEKGATGGLHDLSAIEAATRIQLQRTLSHG